MRYSAILTLAVSCLAASCLSAQVRYTPTDGAVTIDGKPFTIFHRGDDANKPFLAPVRSASGKIVTRGFPMETIAGESRDHLHHRGLWFSFDDVNGVKFWENDPSYTKGVMGKIVVREAKWQNGDHAGTLATTMDWKDAKGKTLVVENRDMTFSGDDKLRTIDFHVALTSAENVTYGDTKEGAFAIRLAEPFTERKGGKISDADGRKGMVNVWGKRSSWVDYSAVVDGEPLGVAIFDHRDNPRYPTYWHARDYGLFALNPFGRKAFDPKEEESQWKVPAGQKLEFRWRVLVHPGDAAVADLYQKYSPK
jgi:hypothetical protein